MELFLRRQLELGTLAHGDCSSTSSPNEVRLGCFEELPLLHELHNFTDTTVVSVIRVASVGTIEAARGYEDHADKLVRGADRLGAIHRQGAGIKSRAPRI